MALPNCCDIVCVLFLMGPYSGIGKADQNLFNSILNLVWTVFNLDILKKINLPLCLDWNDQHLLLLMTTKQIYIYLRDLWRWPGDCLALQESFPDFGVLDMHLEVILGYFSITVHHALQSWHLRFLYLLISLNISIRWIEIYCNGTVTSWMVDSST